MTTDTQTKQLDEHRNLYLNLDCNKHSRQKRSNQSSCKQDYCKLIIRGRQRNNSLGQLFESYDLFLRDQLRSDWHWQPAANCLLQLKAFLITQSINQTITIHPQIRAVTFLVVKPSRLRSHFQTDGCCILTSSYSDSISSQGPVFILSSTRVTAHEKNAA